VWAAAWLYYATNDQSYLDQAESLYNQYGLNYRPQDFGWDNKVAGVQVSEKPANKKQPSHL